MYLFLYIFVNLFPQFSSTKSAQIPKATQIHKINTSITISVNSPYPLRTSESVSGLCAELHQGRLLPGHRQLVRGGGQLPEPRGLGHAGGQGGCCACRLLDHDIFFLLQTSYQLAMSLACTMGAVLMWGLPLVKFVASPALFFLWVCLMFVCIGATFSLIPFAVHKCFGGPNFAIAYGLCQLCLVSRLSCSQLSGPRFWAEHRQVCRRTLWVATNTQSLFSRVY